MIRSKVLGSVFIIEVPGAGDGRVVRGRFALTTEPIASLYSVRGPTTKNRMIAAVAVSRTAMAALPISERYLMP